MSDSLNPFDPILLSQVRMGIVAVLMTREEATFSDLKALLGLTQGNLGVHLQKLEEASYVSIKKEFVGRRPRTTARITKKGRRAFQKQLEVLQEIASGRG